MKTSEAKFLLVFKYGKRCGICGKKIKSFRDATVDHIIPLNRGGKNTIMNYQLAHEFCNIEKGNLMPEEYAYLKRYKRFRALKCFLSKILLIRRRKVKPNDRQLPSENPWKTFQRHALLDTTRFRRETSKFRHGSIWESYKLRHQYRKLCLTLA